MVVHRRRHLLLFWFLIVRSFSFFSTPHRFFFHLLSIFYTKTAKMATEMLAGGRPTVQSVKCKRRLFDKPSEADREEFTNKLKLMEQERARAFQEKWAIDILNENNNPLPDGDFKWFKCCPTTDGSIIPDFYTRGFRSKLCRRKPVKRCVGNALSFSDDYKYEKPPVVASYDTRESLELFIGVSLSQPHTPARSTKSTTTESPSSTTTTSNVVSVSVPEDCQTPTRDCDHVNNPSSEDSNSENVRPRRQLKITEFCPIRKRARSLSTESSKKRERRDV